MRRRPLVAANWKMYTSSAEADSLATEVRNRLSGCDTDIVLCPPFVWLDRVARILEDSLIQLGAQNTFWAEAGKFTGEVSPVQLSELCTHVIVGHSERRTILGETDEMVARKVAAATAAGLTPILAVGEDLKQYQAGTGTQVVRRQLAAAVPAGWDGPLVVAYEPVWAIGTGHPATPEYAGSVAQSIREELSRRVPDADAVRILYGGSVTSASYAEFVAHPEVDGALVGGASLDLDEFCSLVQATAVSPT